MNKGFIEYKTTVFIKDILNGQLEKYTKNKREIKIVREKRMRKL